MTDLEEISYRNIVLDSLPMMIGNTMEVLIMTINLHYATNNVMVAGLGLSMILVHSLGGSLLYGFNNGYSTHASRAFGANNRTKFSKYCIQGFLNLFLLLILLVTFGLFTYQLCILTGQQEEVAAEAHRFYVWQLPGLCFFFTADFLRNYLNSQAIFQPLNYANAFACIFHVAISACLSRPFGFYGIVLSTNLTFLVLLLLTIFTLYKHSKWPLNRELLVFEGWQEDYKAFFEECLYVALPFLLDLFMF
jgi:Na+-driven multidrug efflux pump